MKRAESIGTPAPTVRRGARRLFFIVHFYAALIAGVFILILGLTGSIMACESELDHILHWKLWHVQPGPRAMSLAEITAAVSKSFPGEPINGYTLAIEPNLSWQVSL